MLTLLITMTGCSSRLLVQLKKSQSYYFTKQGIGTVPNDMLTSLHESRKYIFDKKVNQHKINSDTLFLIEGYSIETGITYSVIWSSKISPINYKSHFGKNVEVLNKSLFDDVIRAKVSKLKFDELSKSTSVQDGNLYIASVVFMKNNRISKITHTVFEEPSY